jgi:hypothetical protein
MRFSPSGFDAVQRSHSVSTVNPSLSFTHALRHTTRLRRFRLFGKRIESRSRNSCRSYPPGVFLFGALPFVAVGFWLPKPSSYALSVARTEVRMAAAP